MNREPLLFGVVGIGASAGGLGALTHLVSSLRADTGLAFVVLQHQAESQTGKLAGILGGLAMIPIVDVENGAPVAPNHMYIVPPHTQASLVDGVLVLDGPRAASPRMPIDGLLTSLASSIGERAVGIVLSGTGQDGTSGLRAIKQAGGMTVAQEPSTAEFDEMPRSAINAGVVDVVLPPDRIGREITNLRRAAPPTATARILDQLRDLAGIDFSTYKRSTIERRLERQVSRLKLTSLDEYASYLRVHPAEARALYEDLLVHVTEFFRDRAVFDRVVAQVIPELLSSKADGAPLRAWVPGCSTGEEVYSLAILFLEALAERGDSRTIQIFGTDLSERAIDVARAGRYPAAIGEQVSSQRLARYFVADGTEWRVSPAVRERCVFVRHDLAMDPPFSRLDLVSCRNVLIYMGVPLQQRVIPLFHYALDQPGYLVLGTSETIAGFDALFTQLDPSQPVYRRKPTAARVPLALGVRPPLRRPDVIPPSLDLFREADHVLLSRYAPACVLVDEHFDIVQFRGRTGAFLEPAPGHPQLNVFKMAREGLGTELRSLTIRAQRDGLPVRSEDIVLGETDKRIDLEVIPLRTATTPHHYLIIFEERQSSRTATKQPTRHGTADRVEQLQHELTAAREYVSSVITQNAATSEELGVLNEELQSANEELQSSNEELHTAKEELQSTNDELASLNTELESRNVTLEKLNDDLINVLANVDVAVIILDAVLNVRRFTPKARALFKLIDGDVGRPIGDLQPSVAIPGLAAAITNVIDTLASHEREIRDDEGHSYRLHIRPYRTADQRIGGAVLSFIDITVLRQAIETVERASEAERAAQAVIRREKDAFLDAVSHELRTPLSAILLWTAVIRQSSREPEIVRAIDTIEHCARAEAQLVDDLLDVAMSRTNSGALSIAVQTIDPSAIVEAAVTSLRPSADDKKIHVELALERRASVRADPRRLRQIAWHLVANAIKFTPATGNVRVALDKHDGVIELVVSDDGKGIRSEFLQNVFEPFMQESSSLTREHAGLGVGLAFVRHLVERQDGTIRVESAGEGKGATFTVRLPAA